MDKQKRLLRSGVKKNRTNKASKSTEATTTSEAVINKNEAASSYNSDVSLSTSFSSSSDDNHVPKQKCSRCRRKSRKRKASVQQYLTSHLKTHIDTVIDAEEQLQLDLEKNPKSRVFARRKNQTSTSINDGLANSSQSSQSAYLGNSLTPTRNITIYDDIIKTVRQSMQKNIQHSINETRTELKDNQNKNNEKGNSQEENNENENDQDENDENTPDKNNLSDSSTSSIEFLYMTIKPSA